MSDSNYKGFRPSFVGYLICVVSSAHMNKSPLVIETGRSFTKIENNFGPGIETWGTPYVMVLDPD